MALYLTIYATMNKLLNFFRKKTDKNGDGDKNKGTTLTPDLPPTDDVTPGPSTALASLPPNLSPGLKDALAQLNGEPISKVSK